MADATSLTVVVPALNEEKNLRSAVERLTNVLRTKVSDWEILIVNDGSLDRTGAIADSLAQHEPRISVVHHPRRQGLGACWKDGVRRATKDAIVWFPGDGENDPDELVKYLFLLDHVDLVVPYITNRGVRPWHRRFLSKCFLWVINLSFGTMLSYLTGNVLYRREVFDVITPEANGFFTLVECPIKAVHAGFTYAQVPERLGQRMHGRSTILTLRSIATIVREYLRLLAAIYVGDRRRPVPAGGEAVRKERTTDSVAAG